MAGPTQRRTQLRHQGHQRSALPSPLAEPPWPHSACLRWCAPDAPTRSGQSSSQQRSRNQSPCSGAAGRRSVHGAHAAQGAPAYPCHPSLIFQAAVIVVMAETSSGSLSQEDSAGCTGWHGCGLPMPGIHVRNVTCSLGPKNPFLETPVSAYVSMPVHGHSKKHACSLQYGVHAHLSAGAWTDMCYVHTSLDNVPTPTHYPPGFASVSVLHHFSVFQGTKLLEVQTQGVLPAHARQEGMISVQPMQAGRHL